MKRRITMSLMMGVLFLAAIQAVSAGLYWETSSVQTGMKDSTPEAQISKTYHSGSAMRIESADSIMIFDMKKAVMYQLQPKKKLYTTIDFNKMFSKDTKEGKTTSEMAATMQNMMNVQKTDETKTINGYKCKKYIITLMGMTTEYWVTTEIKEFKKLNDEAKVCMKKIRSNPMLAGFLGPESLDQIDGFPMRTITKMGKVTTESTVVKVKPWKVDPKMFEIPADYAAVKSNF